MFFVVKTFGRVVKEACADRARGAGFSTSTPRRCFAWLLGRILTPLTVTTFRVLSLCLALAQVATHAESLPPPPAAAAPINACGLTFERGEISLVAQPGQEKLETAFTFVNRTDATVTIQEARAACGCTVPTLTKTVYAPGEAGQVDVTFAVGSRQGPQHLVVTVRTDRGEQTLLLKVDIPPRVELTPRLVMFRGGETGTKTARVRFLADTPVVLGEHRVSDPNFHVVVRPVTPGSDYEVELTYSGPAQDARTAFIDLPSTGASGRPAEDRLFVRHSP